MAINIENFVATGGNQPKKLILQHDGCSSFFEEWAKNLDIVYLCTNKGSKDGNKGQGPSLLLLRSAFGCFNISR